MAQPYFLTLKGYIKQDKKAFTDELKRKGYKLTGREGLDKLTEMVLGLHKNLINKPKQDA